MRKLLVRAAYAAIAERGFTAVTLQEVASRAGVSKGLPLYYFPSKEALFAAVMERTAAAILRRLAQALAAVEGPRARLESYLDALTLNAAEHRDFYRVYVDFLSQGVRNPDLHQSTRHFILGCQVLEQEIVTQGIATGVFRQGLDPAEAAANLRALIDGISLQWLFSPDQNFESFRQRLRQAVIHYLSV